MKLFIYAISAFCLLFQIVSAAEISVSPSERLWLQSSKIIVEDAIPGGRVVIEASLKDAAGIQWTSQGVYYADIDGRVDVAQNASISGTYTGIDERGLIWSMLPTDSEGLKGCAKPDCMPDDVSRIARFRPTETVQITYTAIAQITAADAQTETVRATQQVGYTKPGVTRTEVSEGDLRGVYYAPEGNGPHPAVMIVTGSGGGVHESTAALLASNGIASFAIGHFNYKDRPNGLADIPLEYFRDGIDWLRAKTGAKLVGLTGGSRGGEAVVLIASTWPEKVGAVVSGVPSNVAWQGCCGPEEGKKPSWTLNGQGVPTSQYAFDDSQGFDTETEILAWRDFFLGGMLEEGQGVISVEKIDAPILFITGDADQIWPATVAADLMVRRLAKHNFAHPVKHLNYSGAGHMASSNTPITSLTDLLFHPVTRTPILMGGTASANAAAMAHSSAQRIKFFLDNLKTD